MILIAMILVFTFSLELAGVICSHITTLYIYSKKHSISTSTKVRSTIRRIW
ncbi:hypothetical protein Hanom_Chr11g00974621 [Helianthus anomalus]